MPSLKRERLNMFNTEKVKIIIEMFNMIQTFLSMKKLWKLLDLDGSQN